MKPKIIEDIYPAPLDKDTIVVMVVTGDGKEYSIGEVTYEDNENAELEDLYFLAYEVAHEAGYVLSGEC